MTSTTDDNDGRVWCFQCGNEYDEEITECTECGVPTTCDPPIDVSSVGDVDDDQLAYEFHEWTGQGRSTLDGMLTRSGIDHAWQGATLIVREFDKDGDLFVYEKDEEKIDEVFSGLDEADPDEREFGQGVPGVDPVNVMSDLFVAAARLRKNPNDAKGVVALVEVASIIEQMTLPYGLGADVWGSVVDQSADLSDVLSGDDDSGDVTIEEMSIQLHEFMRRLV